MPFGLASTRPPSRPHPYATHEGNQARMEVRFVVPDTIPRVELFPATEPQHAGQVLARNFYGSHPAGQHQHDLGLPHSDGAHQCESLSSRRQRRKAVQQHAGSRQESTCRETDREQPEDTHPLQALLVIAQRTRQILRMS